MKRFVVATVLVSASLGDPCNGNNCRRGIRNIEVPSADPQLMETENICQGSECLSNAQSAPNNVDTEHQLDSGDNPEVENLDGQGEQSWPAPGRNARSPLYDRRSPPMHSYTSRGPAPRRRRLEESIALDATDLSTSEAMMRLGAQMDVQINAGLENWDEEAWDEVALDEWFNAQAEEEADDFLDDIVVNDNESMLHEKPEDAGGDDFDDDLISICPEDFYEAYEAAAEEDAITAEVAPGSDCNGESCAIQSPSSSELRSSPPLFQGPPPPRKRQRCSEGDAECKKKREERRAEFRAKYCSYATQDGSDMICKPPPRRRTCQVEDMECERRKEARRAEWIVKYCSPVSTSLPGEGQVAPEESKMICKPPGQPCPEQDTACLEERRAKRKAAWRVKYCQVGEDGQEVCKLPFPVFQPRSEPSHFLYPPGPEFSPPLACAANDADCMSGRQEVRERMEEIADERHDWIREHCIDIQSPNGFMMSMMPNNESDNSIEAEGDSSTVSTPSTGSEIDNSSNQQRRKKGRWWRCTFKPQPLVCPEGEDGNECREQLNKLISKFEKHRNAWIKSRCTKASDAPSNPLDIDNEVVTCRLPPVAPDRGLPPLPDDCDEACRSHHINMSKLQVEMREKKRQWRAEHCEDQPDDNSLFKCTFTLTQLRCKEDDKECREELYQKARAVEIKRKEILDMICEAKEDGQYTCDLPRFRRRPHPRRPFCLTGPEGQECRERLDALLEAWKQEHCTVADDESLKCPPFGPFGRCGVDDEGCREAARVRWGIAARGAGADLPGFDGWEPLRMQPVPRSGRRDGSNDKPFFMMMDIEDRRRRGFGGENRMAAPTDGESGMNEREMSAASQMAVVNAQIMTDETMRRRLQGKSETDRI